MAHLGCVDPFQLSLREFPPGGGEYRVAQSDGWGDGESRPLGMDRALGVERAGLCIVGASQALMDLSMRWFLESQPPRAFGAELPTEPPALGEMRMVVRRREAKLLGALLRRHVARLPQPPQWMAELLRAIEEMDEFLRWQAD